MKTNIAIIILVLLNCTGWILFRIAQKQLQEARIRIASFHADTKAVIEHYNAIATRNQGLQAQVIHLKGALKRASSILKSSELIS